MNTGLPPSRILILTALVPEAQALARAIGLSRTAAPIPTWSGKNIVLAVVGIRATRLDEWLDSRPGHMPQVVVMAGLAGGLSPQLRVGDIVVEAPGKLPVGDGGRGGYHEGRIHTTSRLITNPADKQRLFAQTGCIAVEMEQAIVREYAASVGAIFIGVRAISDAASDALDPTVMTLVTELGEPRIGKAMALICRHPTKLPELLRLGHSSRLALRNLGEWMRHLFASGWPDTVTDLRKHTDALSA